MKKIEEALKDRKKQGNLRVLPNLNPGIDFLSNDYLGLANREIKSNATNGSTGSRLLSGNKLEIETLENKDS